MKQYAYVQLDPTGNLTDLVTEPVPAEDEPRVTEELMKDCEQVAYLEPARQGGRARIRLMGGEFCGNAAMAAACYLVRDELQPGEEALVPLEVSGAEGVLPCRVKRLADGFEGTVPMPKVISIQRETWGGLQMAAVRMEGILHMICEEPLDSDEAAERLLREIASAVPDEAVGLIQWKAGTMRPLVYVRGSDTMVWETGCGSGSAAVGAWEAVRRGRLVQTMVKQPGGIIRVEAQAKKGNVCKLSITGLVRIGRSDRAFDEGGKKEV